MATSADAPQEPVDGRRTGSGRLRVWAAAGAALAVLVALLRGGDAGGNEPIEHLQALLPVPPEFPPGWWSLDFRDGAAYLMAPTGTNEHIGEVVRFDDQLELGPVPDCGDGGRGLYDVVHEEGHLRFEAMGADGCAPRQEVLTAGTWRRYTPPPMTTRIPDVRPAEVLAAVAVEGAAARLAMDSGDLWVASVASRHLERIDTATGTVTERVDVGFADVIPGLAARDGVLWLSNWRRNTVARIDAATGIVTATIEVGQNPPGGISVGDGAVWVANAHDGTVSRVDAEANAVTQTIHLAEPGDGGPQAVVEFGDDVLVSVPRDNEIARVDSRTGEVSPFFTGRVQSRLAATQDTVWTFEGLDATWVTRIRADGAADLRVSVGEGRHPRALATTDDLVWVLTVGRRSPPVDLELLRIDARAGEVTDRLGLRRLAERNDMVLDDDGDVWLTAGDEVVRIDGG